MKVIIFNIHDYEKNFFIEENKYFSHELNLTKVALTESSAQLASGHQAVCAFVNDHVNSKIIEILSLGGTKLIALRSAGFNNIDLFACEKFGIRVLRVPEYSPHAIAEHAVALMLSLNRKINRSYNNVREGNFSIDALIGFDLYKKTIGIMGTGKIGTCLAKIMLGFGCDVQAFDLVHNPILTAIGVEYVSLDKLLNTSDVISLHLPLTDKTRYIIDQKTISKMKTGVMLINTGRGALINTKELILGLKSGSVGYAGLDVYEKEEGVFFENHVGEILNDDLLALLITFPNVIVTSHQAFLTKEALRNIAHITLKNIEDFEQKRDLVNEVTSDS